MERFLAIQDLANETPETLRETLKRLDEAADELGIHVTETVYNLERRKAWSIFEADTVERVQEAHDRAGLSRPDVCHADIIYTELLREPRRAR